MKILFAGLFHETHCFVPDRTGLADFKIEKGEAIFKRRGDGSQVDGFFEVADREGWEVVPACNYVATPSGIVEDVVYDSFWSDLEPVARQCGADGVDGIYLSLHGAMVTETTDDVEGRLITALRAVPGLEEVPVVGVFDLHANFTEAMCRATALTCYRENPHSDARQSSVRAAEMLARCLKGGRPRLTRRSVPLIWPPTGTGTVDTPMRELEAAARRAETDSASIWGVNVVAGYSFADVHDAGVCFSVVGEDDAVAGRVLDELAGLAFRLRDKGIVRDVDIDAAMRDVMEGGRQGPVILVEPSDNIGGGAPGNGTGVLRAFLAADAGPVGVIINDPEAVAALADAAPGETRRLPIGGKDNPMDEGPVTLDVTLVSRSDGRFELEDVQSHMAASRGRHIDMGPCAVVRHRGVTILLTSRRTAPNDLGQWRSQGIEPAALKAIGVKAAVAHRRAYDRIGVASFTVETPGACISNPAKLPYRKLRRPIFPLDEIEVLP